MRVALVHDWLPFMGGAENVLVNIHELFPKAPIYTSICNRNQLDESLKDADIITSHLQKNGREIKNHRKLFPYMPTAMEQFDLTDYDLVISSSSSVAKCIITSPSTLHICYCNTPMRYGWEFMHEYIGTLTGKGSMGNKLKAYLMTLMRIWDYSNSARVDYFIGNSINVAKRIKKHYRRECYALRAPVRCMLFHFSNTNEDFYLCVSRLQEYKRVDIAVRACNKLGIPLVIIGDGPEKKKLEMIAGPTVKFLGRVSKEIIIEHYAKCKALIFPGEEDFGITPLEAQASGRPVIAYGKGGALETIVDGKTGVFFYEQTPESLVEAIHKVESMKFDKNVLRENAMQFDETIFKEKIKSFIEEKYKEFKEQEMQGIIVL
jgi:glycosyltransferase involved in cell wall biosynthesis